MKKIIKIGLIGYGNGGKFFHAPIIESVDGLKLYKTYVTKPENVEHLKRTYEDVQVASNVDNIVLDPVVDLVVVVTHNSSHYELVKKALENGKNVVVDKPFTITTQEADELISLAKKKNKLLSVYHNRRWDSDFRTVEKVVKSELLGDIVNFETNFDRYNPSFRNLWKEKNLPGSGALYDLGSHLIDQALCLFGLPKEVFAQIEIQKQGGEVEDYFNLILKYSNLNVTLKASALVREAGSHYTLHGTKGSFLKCGVDPQEAALKSGLMPKNIQSWGVEPEEIWGKINTEVNGVHVVGKVESEVGDYREFYRNIYEAILGEAELKVTPEQGRNVVRIIELAKESNAAGAWIKFKK